jgi:hypothetical protein
MHDSDQRGNLVTVRDYRLRARRGGLLPGATTEPLMLTRAGSDYLRLVVGRTSGTLARWWVRQAAGQ